MNLAQLIDAIPVVQTTSQRDAAFSVPVADQRVWNKESASVQRYDGALASWQDELFQSAAQSLGWFNVRDKRFAGGAKGDGATDDTTAITAALTAAGAIATIGGVSIIGAVAYLSFGHYRTSAPLVVPSGVRMMGAGCFRGTRIAPLNNFSGTAMITSATGGALVDAMLEHFELGINVAGVNGIYFDTCQQRSYIRHVLVNGGGVANVGGYGIKIDSSTPGSTIHIGVQLDQVWVLNPGDHCLIIGPGVGTRVTGFHGENMPVGKASIRVDGTGFVNSGNHEIDGVHHESIAHSSFGVDLDAIASAPCQISNVYSANHNATDTGIRFSSTCAGNMVRHLAWGTNGIVDNNTQAPRTINDWHVPSYQQDSTQQQTGPAGRHYGSVVRRRASYGGTPITPNAQQAEIWEINSNSSPTINAPNATYPPVDGQVFHVRVINSSGGAVTTTWNAVYKLAGAWADPASGKSRTTNFYYDGTSMWEFGRAAADL